MTLRWLSVALTALSSLAAGGAAAQDAPADSRTASAIGSASQAATWDDYRVVVERSIFSRDRRPKAPPTRTTAEPIDRGPPPPPPPLQSSFVLVGVSISDERPVAFVEDRRNGQTHALSEGDTVADRVVVAIAFDQVRIMPLDAPDAEPAAIAIGRTLTGDLPTGPAPSVASSTNDADASATSASSTTAPSGAGASGAAAPSADPSDAQSMIEFLRQRRQQGSNP